MKTIKILLITVILTAISVATIYGLGYLMWRYVVEIPQPDYFDILIFGLLAILIIGCATLLLFFIYALAEEIYDSLNKTP